MCPARGTDPLGLSTITVGGTASAGGGLGPGSVNFGGSVDLNFGFGEGFSFMASFTVVALPLGSPQAGIAYSAGVETLLTALPSACDLGGFFGLFVLETRGLGSFL